MIYLITNQTNLFELKDIKLTTKEHLLEWLKDKKEIQIDTETEFNNRIKDYLPNPYEQKVLSLQIGNYNDQFVLDLSTISPLFLKSIFEDNSIIKVLCNAFFDLRFFIHWGFNTKNVFDIFLAEMVLTTGMKLPKGYRGLAGMAERYLGITLDKNVRGQIHWRGLDETVIIYGAGDVKHMQNIKEKQLIKIRELNLEKCLKLENLFITSIAKISYKGFKIDIIKWLENKDNNIKQLAETKKLLDLEVGKLKLYQYMSYDLFNPEPVCSINWASSKQVISLFKNIEIETKIRDKDKGGFKDSVEGKHLIKQKNKFSILPIYLLYKEIGKEISTYGEDFIKDNINPITKRVHSEFFTILNTGRISSSNPNLQNITATDELGNLSPLRKCFIAEKGNVLIVADYSQQEPRVTAEYSQDPYLIDFILNGDGDSHSLVSTAISEYLLGYEVKVSKTNNPLVPKYNRKIRDIGKMINLGLDYGKTAFSIKDDLEITEKEAQTLIDVLKSKTPIKEEYFKRQIDFVIKNGYIIIDPVSNRRSHFSKYKEFRELEKINSKSKEQMSNYYKIKGSMERFAMNFPIQGTSGSMTKLAAIYFDQELEKQNLLDKAWLVNLVHDECVVESKEEYSKQVAEIIQSCMVKAGGVFCKKIPMIVEPELSLYWKK